MLSKLSATTTVWEHVVSVCLGKHGSVELKLYGWQLVSGFPSTIGFTFGYVRYCIWSIGFTSLAHKLARSSPLPLQAMEEAWNKANGLYMYGSPYKLWLPVAIAGDRDSGSLHPEHDLSESRLLLLQGREQRGRRGWGGGQGDYKLLWKKKRTGSNTLQLIPFLWSLLILLSYKSQVQCLWPCLR